MGQPLAISTGDRRFLREKCSWKILAILQLLILLWLFLNRNISIDIDPTSSSLLPVKDVNLLENGPEPLKNGNSRLNSSDLEMFQSQTELSLVRKIRTNWLKPPSERELPYNFTPDTTTDLSAVKRLHKIVLEQFGGKTNGFFIECGAFDGVWLSNTLHLEEKFNWTGLLIEADGKYYGRLAMKQRKAWTMNACLSIKPYEEKVQMTRIRTEDALSLISEFAEDSFRKRPEAETFQVQCFPLTSILAALERPLNVDYFSLDVEGAELKILQAVPWNFVNIKVITLEANEQRVGPLVEFLASKSYKLLEHVRGPWINDHVFVHKQFMHDRQFAVRNESEINVSGKDLRSNRVPKIHDVEDFDNN